jgi:histidine ammonia-lyase
VRNVLAIELLCAAQGLDYRRPLRSSKALERAHEIVRASVPVLERDRPVSPDILSIAQLIGEGSFTRLVTGER